MTDLDKLIKLEVKLFPQKQLLRGLPENSKNREIELGREHCLEVIKELEAQIYPLRKSLDNGEEIKYLEVRVAEELESNNVLREVIMIYSKAFDKVKSLADDLDTSYEEKQLHKIAKDLHEAILKL